MLPNLEGLSLAPTTAKDGYVKNLLAASGEAAIFADWYVLGIQVLLVAIRRTHEETGRCFTNIDL